MQSSKWFIVVLAQAGNWLPGLVPGMLNDVIIPTSPNDPVISSGQSFQIKTLEVKLGAQLTCDGEMIIMN